MPDLDATIVPATNSMLDAEVFAPNTHVLVEMGYAEEIAAEALRMYDGDLNRAAANLLHRGEQASVPGCAFSL